MTHQDAALSYTVRRIVTGHDDRGLAVVKRDETLDALPVVAGFFGLELWQTGAMPVSNDDPDPDARPPVSVEGARTSIRVTEMPPGGVSKPIMHRAQTLDYVVVLAGECDMALDGGTTVHLETGDIVIQRGTNHAWVNDGASPCRFLFVSVDASPAKVGDRTLGALLDAFPDGQVPGLQSSAVTD